MQKKKYFQTVWKVFRIFVIREYFKRIFMYSDVKKKYFAQKYGVLKKFKNGKCNISM